MIATSFTDKLDAGKGPEQLFAERAQRITDAAEMRQPDRIPVMMPASYLLAQFGGITKQELHEDFEGQAALEGAALYFKPDLIFGPIGGPEMIKYLGDTSWKYPGHGVGVNEAFQYVEGEYLKADEYDDFLTDPGDFALRTYLPARLHQAVWPEAVQASGAGQLRRPGHEPGRAAVAEMLEALDTLKATAQAQIAGGQNAMQSMQRMAALGFPSSRLLQRRV